MANFLGEVSSVASPYVFFTSDSIHMGVKIGPKIG